MVAASNDTRQRIRRAEPRKGPDGAPGSEGKTNKEVASRLGLSVHTVDTHRGNILQKLNLHSVPELILYAVRKKIIA